MASLKTAVPPAPTFLERGFTLTEMAVVLVIVALLIGGMVIPMAAQQDLRYASETQKQLADIHEALVGFTVANGRLPCPASATVASATSGAGQEATTGSGATLTCTNVSGVGVLPWATLGVRETDAWGNRFTYRVTIEFARGATGQTSFTGTNCPPPVNSQLAAFSTCSQGALSILSSSGGNTIAIGVPAAVISHGKNGFGAYTPQGTQLAAGTDADETDNQLTGSTGSTMANTNFVSRSPTASFDDFVGWISPNILVYRMVTAGRLP